jgi:hypothetical protein
MFARFIFISFWFLLICETTLADIRACQSFYIGQKTSVFRTVYNLTQFEEILFSSVSKSIASRLKLGQTYSIHSWLEQGGAQKPQPASAVERRPRKIINSIYQIVWNPAVKVLFDPFRYVKADDVTVPKDLLEKIARDGYEKHWAEIKDTYFQSNQPYVDRWNRIINSARVLTAVLAIFSASQMATQTQNIIKELRGEELVKSVKSMSMGLDELEQRLDIEYEKGQKLK